MDISDMLEWSLLYPTRNENKSLSTCPVSPCLRPRRTKLEFFSGCNSFIIGIRASEQFFGCWFFEMSQQVFSKEVCHSLPFQYVFGVIVLKCWLEGSSCLAPVPAVTIATICHLIAVYRSVGLDIYQIKCVKSISILTFWTFSVPKDSN